MNDDATLNSLLGGELYNALKRDGSSESITVEHFPIRKVIALVPHIDDEPRMVELFAGKPEGWADTLAPVAYEHIYEKGWAANYPSLDAYLRRKVRLNRELLEKIAPTNGKA